MSDKMELNRIAREWLREHRQDLFQKDGVVVLAARPHEFTLRRSGYAHSYLRWTWNIHVHGKSRLSPDDFVLIQFSEKMKVMEIYFVPFAEASKRKSISVYTSLGPAPRQRYATNWIERFRVT